MEFFYIQFFEKYRENFLTIIGTFIKFLRTYVQSKLAYKLIIQNSFELRRNLEKAVLVVLDAPSVHRVFLTSTL